MNDFLVNGGIPVTRYSYMLTFRDSNKSLKLDGDLLEKITNYDFKVDHSNQEDRKLIYEFGKGMKLDINRKGRKSDKDKSIMRLLKSPAIVAAGISKTEWLSSDPDELCARLTLLLQKNTLGIILI